MPKKHSQNSRKANVRSRVRRAASATQRLRRQGMNLGPISSLLSGDGRVYSSEGPQPRVRDLSTQSITVFKTVENFAIITSSTTVPVNISKQFTLADADDYAAYVSAFDQYRIVAIECYLSPQGSNTNHTNDGKITSVIDFDDANTLSGNQALDYSNAVTSSALSNQYRHFVPHVASALYTSTFGGFGNQAAPWIDCASSNVAHYGLKLLTSVSSTVNGYDLVYRMQIQFRSAR